MADVDQSNGPKRLRSPQDSQSPRNWESSRAEKGPKLSAAQESALARPRLDLEVVKLELACNICLDVATHPVTVLPCVHHFCWVCLQGWYKMGRCKCPRCATTTMQAKFNPVLNNLCELVCQTDPSSLKPEDILASETAQIGAYKATNGNDLTLVPKQSKCHGEGDDDEDDDDEDEEMWFWPCPCCRPGNRSGFVCSNPIPNPADITNGQVRGRRPPPRGDEWPDLGVAAGVIAADALNNHTECDQCTRWIPGPRVGVPESICSGCGDTTCCPYDEDRMCPQSEHPWGNVEEHDSITHLFDFYDGMIDEFFDARVGHDKLCAVERRRITEYCVSHGVTLRHIFQTMIAQAKSLSSTESAESLASGTTAAASSGAAHQAAASSELTDSAETSTLVLGSATQAHYPPLAPAAGVSAVPDALLKRRREIISVKDDATRLANDAERPSMLDTSAAKAICHGHWCGHCAVQVFDTLVGWWWMDIVSKHKDALSASLQSLPFCWYGKECQTQHHNAAHAEKYWHLGPATGRPSDRGEGAEDVELSTAHEQSVIGEANSGNNDLHEGGSNARPAAATMVRLEARPRS